VILSQASIAPMGETFGVDIRAIAFDVNGTLIEIRTDDHMDEIFRAAGHALIYQGIDLRRDQVRDRYFELMKEQQRTSAEMYPEFDAVGIWRQIVEENRSDYTDALPAEKIKQLPVFLAEMCRGISRRKLKLYPFVPVMLNALHGQIPMALVTDAQSAYARAELHQAGILDYFDPIIVSGDYGYRKPDPRLFGHVIDALGAPAEKILYVGNDMHRDIYGARQAGMQTLMFDSDQGTKEHQGCLPDHRITDYRDLLSMLGITADPRRT
jgi:putative hydrolase of the HAD superfamily